MKEIRIGILGNVDSGKSTLISVLKEGILDNGRGSARKNILKHKHEKDSGRTSCITHHYYKSIENDTIISFVDLAGHEKYYKTTMFGVNCCSLDYIIIVVGANMGVSRMMIEHLTLTLVLKIPFILVISKTDISPNNILKQTHADIKQLLTKFKVTKKMEHIQENYTEHLTFYENKTIPTFNVSNTTGLNIKNLRNFILKLDSYNDWESIKLKKQFAIIEDIFFVNGVGIVLSLTVTSGIFRKNDRIMLGPFHGKFVEITIKTIHNNFKQHIDYLEAGKSGCFSVKCNEKKFQLKRDILKRGMILVDKTNENLTYSEFEAKVKILHHPSTIKQNYEAMIHCGSIKQVAKITHIDKELLRTGDQSLVKFRFKRRPEFIQTDKQILFREGKTKGVGRITKLIC